VAKAQAFPTGIGGPTAINHQGMTVHKSAVRWIGQEQDSPSDIVR
jgi:hypothetical protein